ncbi:MAG: hypothetical protein WAP48_07805 [Sediminibacterium sp.]
MRIPVSFFFILLFSTAIHAQKKNMVAGFLRDSATKEPVVLASVSNLNTKKTVMTNSRGLFKIELADDQVLSFAAVGYYFDTINFQRKLLKNDTLFLELAPLVRSLGNVTVTSRGMSAYQLDSIERRADFMQNIVNYKIPTVSGSNSGAGIALNIDHFSRKEKNKRKAQAFFETNEREAYINYRFPPAIVTKYSGLKDEALHLFMQLYRPSYEWLRANKTEEDIKYYINDKLKEFNKNK